MDAQTLRVKMYVSEEGWYKKESREVGGKKNEKSENKHDILMSAPLFDL